MFKKRLGALCMVLAICMVPSFVFAGENNNSVHSNMVTVNWVSASSANCSLSISNGEALSYIYLTCNNSNINSANFIMDLQQYKSGKWVTIKKWNITKVVKNYNTVFDQSYAVEKGCKYRCKGTIKIYSNSTLSETISVTSSTKSY